MLYFDRRHVVCCVADIPGKLTLSTLVHHQIVAALGSSGNGEEEKDEDATPMTFVGVYDGHCGALAAELAAAELHRFAAPHKELLVGGGGEGEGEEGKDEAATRVAKAGEVWRAAYAKTEAMLLARLRREGNRQDGAAAVTAAVAGRHLYVANVGDCRAVLVRFGEIID